MVSVETAPIHKVEQKTFKDFHGFAIVITSEAPYDHTNFLVAESLGSFPRPGMEAVEGWRIYYGERGSFSLTDDRIVELLHSTQWFALHTKGPDIIGMYFPQSADTDLVLHAADAYFRSNGAIVDVPDRKFFNLTEKYNVPNPYSGKPEFCLDLVVGDPGRARINGRRVRGVEGAK